MESENVNQQSAVSDQQSAVGGLQSEIGNPELKVLLIEDSRVAAQILKNLLAKVARMRFSVE